MNKFRVLIGAVVLLALLNLVLLALLYLGHPNHRNNHRPEKTKDLIIAELGLDKQQEAEFLTLVEQHKAEIDNFRDQQLVNRDALFKSLKYDDADVHQSLIDRSGRLQMQLDKQTVDHFLEVKQLLREDQLDEFDQLLQTLAQRMRPPRPRNHKNEK